MCTYTHTHAFYFNISNKILNTLWYEEYLLQEVRIYHKYIKCFIILARDVRINLQKVSCQKKKHFNNIEYIYKTLKITTKIRPTTIIIIKQFNYFIG